MQPGLDRRLRHDDDRHVKQQHEDPGADRDQGPPFLVHRYFLPLMPFPAHPAGPPDAAPNSTAITPESDICKVVFVKTSQLDEVDRQLLHALVVAPRASFRVLAAALGVSDQTIARRYRRLAESADLRVTGLIHGPRAGWVDWMVRLQVAPGSAQRIADSLAQRPDTRWGRLYSVRIEIVCPLEARTPDERKALFLRGLPGSRHVTGITAQSILHVFSPVAYVTLPRSLAPDQLSALTEAAPEPPPQPQWLDRVPALGADAVWTPPP